MFPRWSIESKARERSNQSGRRRPEEPSRSRRRGRPALEVLEPRTLLAANLSLVGTPYLVNADGEPFDPAAVPEGCPVFIHKEWTATDLPTTGRDGTGAYVVQNFVDGVGLWHPGGWPWGVGTPGTTGWYENWGGWQTTPGTHDASVTLDGFDNFAETDEAYDNSAGFTFTTVAKPTVTIRATEPLAHEAGARAGLPVTTA